MESKPIRSVIGVYSADEGESSKAYRALCAAHAGEVRLYSTGETADPAKQDDRERYTALRLEGECLIVVKTAPSKVPAIVQTLQSSGSPAVFVVPDDRSDLEVPETVAATLSGSESIEEFARICAERRGKPGTPRPRILSELRKNELTLEAS